MDQQAAKPFRKFRIVFFCFFVMFILVLGYFEFYVNLQTGYWEICKIVGLLVLLSVALLFKKVRSNESWATIIKVNIWLLLFVVIWGWQFYDNYTKDVCMDKFGKEFNQRRRSLGMPVIPSDWQIDYFRRKNSTNWKKKDTIGHYYKTTGVDSACQITYEVDKYNFKPYRGVSRSMSSEYRFGNGRDRDTMVFYYEAGAGSRTITHQQADSIFAAEKIQKDY